MATIPGAPEKSSLKLTETSHSYRAGAGSYYTAPSHARHHKRRQIEHPRQRKTRRPSHVGLLTTTGIILVATWLPGLVGESIEPAILGWWGRESGYLGLSWLLPACLIGIATDRAVGHAELAWHTSAGWLAGISTTITLLLGAAQIIGG
jgi:hypothetical protein